MYPTQVQYTYRQELKGSHSYAMISNHADLRSTMSSAHCVIEHFLLTQVYSRPCDTETDPHDLLFPVHLKARQCKEMATNQLDCLEADAAERTLLQTLSPGFSWWKSAMPDEWSRQTMHVV